MSRLCIFPPRSSPPFRPDHVPVLASSFVRPFPVIVYRYTELPDQQAFFNAAKRSPRIICHFYRPTTRYCQVVDAHMERLAHSHLETRVRRPPRLYQPVSAASSLGHTIMVLARPANGQPFAKETWLLGWGSGAQASTCHVLGKRVHHALSFPFLPSTQHIPP